jgi:phosphonate transport system permease protein
MTRSEEKLKQQPNRLLVNFLFTFGVIAAMVYSFSTSNINWYRLNNLEASLNSMINGLLSFRLDFLLGLYPFDFNEGIVYFALETVAIGLLGTMIGAILALPFGFLASRTVMGKKWSKLSEAFLVLVRVFPEIMLALILVKGFGMNALTGVITIGLHSVGMLGKLYAETIDNMDKSPIEALDATGANILQKIRYGIIPQITPDIVSTTLYRFDINIRSATVLGIIGAGQLGTALLIASENWQWPMLGGILIAIVVMVISIDMLSSYLRNKLV